MTESLLAESDTFDPPLSISGMSNANYHRSKALGSTSLKTLATRTPAHWKAEQEHPVTSTAFELGTVAHSLILEADDSGVAVIDVEDKRGKKWSEPAEEARAADKIPLTTAEWDQVRGMRDSVFAHDDARVAFTGHAAETSIFWSEGSINLKCRPDAWHEDKNLVIDLKSCQSADPRRFGKIAADYGYFQQAAHYMQGVAAATGESEPAFLFVLVEKQRPWLTSIVELDSAAIEMGRRMNERAKRVYAECLTTDHWPGYPQISPVGLPIYAERQMEELLDD